MSELRWNVAGNRRTPTIGRPGGPGGKGVDGFDLVARRTVKTRAATTREIGIGSRAHMAYSVVGWGVDEIHVFCLTG